MAADGLPVIREPGFYSGPINLDGMATTVPVKPDESPPPQIRSATLVYTKMHLAALRLANATLRECIVGEGKRPDRDDLAECRELWEKIGIHLDYLEERA